MNVKEKFLQLTSETYPYPHESELLKFLPNLDQDSFGNYYKKIGESSVIFACHLDTASHKKEKVNHRFFVDEKGKHSSEGDEWIYTAGTILGADDKAGVVVLLYMMEKQIPGIYYFFIGEERGCIGSGRLSDAWGTKQAKHVEHVNKIISFDRKAFTSIITHQMGRQSCSNKFATSLSKEYNKYGLMMVSDSGGIYTDSAQFTTYIPECTNISIGYFDEHSTKERQNITFLKKLCEASAKVDWEGLPVDRQIGVDSYYVDKYGPFLHTIENLIDRFYNTLDVYSEDNLLVIELDVDDDNLWTLYKEISTLRALFNQHGLKDMHWIELSGQTLKIMLA